MTRFGYFMTTYLAMLAAGGLAFVHPAPRVIWNATASTPTGLYTLHPIRQLRTTELVVVRPPDAIASVLAKGGFLPRGVPLLKQATPSRSTGLRPAKRRTAITWTGHCRAGAAARRFKRARSSS
jgi:type IV secretory pathway protease TraF